MGHSGQDWLGAKGDTLLVGRGRDSGRWDRGLDRVSSVEEWDESQRRLHSLPNADIAVCGAIAVCGVLDIAVTSG